MTTHPELRQDLALRFVAETPVHVGGAAGDTVTDLPLATDSCGRLLVPGTSWAGVLRALARRHLPAAEPALFGSADDDGHASRLTVADSVVGRDAGVQSRTGVAIDRRHGSAANRLVYDRMVLAAGTELTLDLRYEGPDTGDAVALVGLVRALGLRIGAASSRGLGRLRCTDATVRSTDLTSRNELLALLAGTAPTTDVQPARDVDGLVPRVELTWRTRRPVVVGAGSPGQRADLVPLLSRSADGNGLVPVLPGSTVKGVLRAAAERVLRTVLDIDDPAADLAARSPAFEVLFGSLDRAGALAVPDTSSLAQPVSDGEWRRYLAANRDECTEIPWSRERQHVGIDRWAGGAAPGRLFTVQETEGVRWQPLRLELDELRLRDLGPGRRAAVVVLLGMAVALVQEGFTGFGHGTTRGLGEIEVTGTRVIGAETLGLPPYVPGMGWWDWLCEVAYAVDIDSTTELVVA